jgi:hypothetical protein
MTVTLLKSDKYKELSDLSRDMECLVKIFRKTKFDMFGVGLGSPHASVLGVL